MATINTGNYYGTNVRLNFTKKEIKAVMDTFKASVEGNPILNLTLMMEATNSIKNDKTH